MSIGGTLFSMIFSRSASACFIRNLSMVKNRLKGKLFIIWVHVDTCQGTTCSKQGAHECRNHLTPGFSIPAEQQANWHTAAASIPGQERLKAARIFHAKNKIKKILKQVEEESHSGAAKNQHPSWNTAFSFWLLMTHSHPPICHKEGSGIVLSSQTPDPNEKVHLWLCCGCCWKVLQQ